jgi:hypothetical protein
MEGLIAVLLRPENLEFLRENKKLVKALTKNKLLPSSIRLYIRNLAGVTDKITEDFFSKSELKEIKKRVSEAKAAGSMGDKALSGLTSAHKDNIIGYSQSGFIDQLSLKGVFTDPNVNIDMTLGQATFDTDKDGNVVVKDIHDFKGVEGSGYKGKQLQKRIYEQPVPHPYEEGSIMDTLLGDVDISRVSKTEESDKHFLERAQKELKSGNIDPSKYARIVAGLERGEGIPIEIDIGKITHKDKLESSPAFAEYLATNLDIPTQIRNEARKYSNWDEYFASRDSSNSVPFKNGGLVGFGLTLLESRDNPHAGVETLFERK